MVTDVDPDALLFTDKDGVKTQLQDVIYDGLDRDYADRYPALVRLMQEGTPAQRLFACVMLASWGVAEGLTTLIGWARDPASTPWADQPVTFDRMYGVDSAFEMLAEAMRVAGELEQRDQIAARRAEAVRALLAIYDRVWFGRSLAVVLDLDPALARELADAIGSAVERALAAAPTTDLDLATQAAYLLGPLAAVDDPRAARAATALLDAHPTKTQSAREVAHALMDGTGPATRAVLERLVRSGSPAVRDEAKTSLSRRAGS